MKQYVNDIYQKIDVLNPLHGKKLKKNIGTFDDKYYQESDAFFEKYFDFLKKENKTLDYAVDCYLNMISDVNIETVEFVRTGKYTSSTFEEVNKRVYAKPETMEYYMHGLIMSQFLWKHHYEMYDYFVNELPAYKDRIKSYLEVGAGHGLTLSKALEILNPGTSFSVVDISETSIALAKNFVNDSRVSYNLRNVFEFKNEEKYDFITMGEVLEHVEDPLMLLKKLNEMLNDDGHVFFTTPTNAPAIDHISLFNNVDEIRDLVKAAGFEIVSERSLLSEDVSPQRAEKFKIAILYGAFLKKAGK